MSSSFHSTGWRVSCRISLRKFLRSLLKSNSIWWISAPWPLISRHAGTDWGAKSNQQILNFAQCQSLFVAQMTPKWAVELSQVWPFAFILSKQLIQKANFRQCPLQKTLHWIWLRVHPMRKNTRMDEKRRSRVMRRSLFWEGQDPD